MPTPQLPYLVVTTDDVLSASIGGYGTYLPKKLYIYATLNLVNGLPMLHNISTLLVPCVPMFFGTSMDLDRHSLFADLSSLSISLVTTNDPLLFCIDNNLTRMILLSNTISRPTRVILNH